MFKIKLAIAAITVVLFMANYSHAEKIYQVGDLQSFVELKSGRGIYAANTGELHEVVLKPDGEIINTRVLSRAYRDMGIRKILPFLQNGLVIYTQKGDVYAHLNAGSIKLKGLLIAQDVDLV